MKARELRLGIHDRAVDEPGKDRVDANPFGRVHVGDLSREVIECGLRGRVSDERVGGNAQARRSRNVGDDVSPALFHVRERVLASQKGALQIRVEREFPVVLAQIDGASELQNADIVVENVDVLVDFERLLDRRFHFGRTA